MSVTVRRATPADIPAVAAIYAHYVTNTVATFEEVPGPSAADMLARHEKLTSAGFPYLVAILPSTSTSTSEKVVGYAYAGPHRDRRAYNPTVEDSIFLSPSHTGKGIGPVLLAALLDECEKGGWRQVLSIIADIDGAGRGSKRIHEQQGFRVIGNLEKVGWKMDKWIDVGMMQKTLGVGSSAPPPATYGV